MIVEKIIGNIEKTNTKNKEVDKVILSHEEIQKPHQKVVSEGNRQIKISLDRKENLYCGAILYEDEKLVVVVDMPLEKSFEIRPKSSMEWAKAAYNIGNMHQSAYLYKDCIRVPYDQVLENMVKAIDVDFVILEAKLDGQRPNVSSVKGSGHSH